MVLSANQREDFIFKPHLNFSSSVYRSLSSSVNADITVTRPLAASN